jgi:hypothetical protein
VITAVKKGGLALPKFRGFQNWYFEYMEARRAFEDAKRNLKMKSAELELFAFPIYEKWCAEKFGSVIRPWFWVIDGSVQEPVKMFYEDFQVYDIRWKSILTRLLNQAFDKKYPNWKWSDLSK